MSQPIEPKKIRKSALLIGNDYYDQKSSRLKTSIKNAETFEKLLKKAKFKVEKICNTNEEQIKEKVRSFVDKTAEFDVSLFYYAGHACHVNDRNYLIPIDDEKITKYDDIPNFSLDFHGMVERIKGNSKGVVILILDAPHRYAPEKTPTTTSTTAGPGLVNMKVPHKMIVQFACAVKETAGDEKGIDRKQLFHKRLMTYIMEPNVDIFEILNLTNSAVQLDSVNHQSPMTIRDTNDYPQVIIHEIQMLELADIPYGAHWGTNGITVAGGFGAGPTNTRLNTPRGFYVTNKQETVISDRNNHRVIKFNPVNPVGKTLLGSLNGRYLFDRLYGPSDVVYDKARDEIIISDTHNREVITVDSELEKQNGAIINNLHCRGIAFDKNGFLYVCDAERHEVRRFGDNCGPHGILVAGGNGQGNRLHQLNYPSYVSIGPNGSVYISDSWNNRVVRWDKDAEKGVIVAGGQGSGKNLNQLFGPTGLIVDKLETVYVADYWNHRVMRWYKDAKEGEIIIGNRFLGGNEPDHLNLPEGLAFDRFGNLYVADSNNHRIQRFNIRKAKQSSLSDN